MTILSATRDTLDMEQGLVFVLGLAVGSFLNVLADRLPQGRPVLVGRSECDFCHRSLRWFELIPVVSYIIQAGRCRRCHQSLSLQYPLVELTTGIGLMLLYSLFHYSLMLLLAYSLIFSVLLVIFVADLKYQIIPDSMVLLAVIGGWLRLWQLGPFSLPHWRPYLLSGVGAAGFFLALWFLTRGRGLGLGDVKLSLALGFILGFPNIILALYLSFLTGAAMGVILILRGKKSLKSRMAFGPFLVVGTLVTSLWSEAIWRWVMKFI